MNCSAFRQSIYHFQADELPEAERRALQDHLDRCPDCVERLEFEDSFLRGLKARIGRAPEPPGLSTRVLAALEREHGAAPRATWFRAPWFAAAAASLLLALLLAPWGGSSRAPAESTPVLLVEQEVTVVDSVCDRAGNSYSQQRDCANARHLNALKLEDGTYWSIGLDEGQGSDLLFEPSIRGHRLLVEGRLYPAIRTLELGQVQDLGLVSLNLPPD